MPVAGSERRALSAGQAARVAVRLGAKYQEILVLRDLHVADADPPDVRDRLRALASRYPGALRELDRSDRTEIVARLAALDAVLGGAPLEPWMLATDRVHRWLRVALRRRHVFRGRTVRGRIVPVILEVVARELGLRASEVADLVDPARASARPPA